MKGKKESHEIFKNISFVEMKSSKLINITYAVLILLLCLKSESQTMTP
jgi:hypothetical protein